MKANELQQGMEYKLPGQRKWRTIADVSILPCSPNIPPEHQNKVLITTTQCRQAVLGQNTEVKTKD